MIVNKCTTDCKQTICTNLISMSISLQSWNYVHCLFWLLCPYSSDLWP